MPFFWRAAVGGVKARAWRRKGRGAADGQRRAPSGPGGAGREEKREAAVAVAAGPRLAGRCPGPAAGRRPRGAGGGSAVTSAPGRLGEEDAAGPPRAEVAAGDALAVAPVQQQPVAVRLGLRGESTVSSAAAALAAAQTQQKGAKRGGGTDGDCERSAPSAPRWRREGSVGRLRAVPGLELRAEETVLKGGRL